MPDENNPIIYIEYSDEAFPPVNWESLKEYALDFKVTNSGIFRTPQLDLNLKNRNGRFTGNGDITIQTAKLLRVRADVRDVIDTLFYGIVRPFTSTNKSKREVLNVAGSGLVTQKLLWDRITHEYLTEQNEGSENRTMKQVIEHMLTHPDSDPEGARGDLGVSLVTDSGKITTEYAGHNFDKQALLDAIKQICEYIGYAGYEEVSGSALNLHLYPYGWQATNPAITIPTSPQEIIEREYTVDDPIYNHIYVFASPQICFPDSDGYTERGMEKGYWTANNDDTTITDEIINRINKKCVKLTKPDESSSRIDGTLDLTVDFPNGINLEERLITDLLFDFYSCRPDINCPEGDLNITIYDSDNRFLTWGCGAHSLIADDEFWHSYNIPLGMFANGIWKKAPTHKEAGMTEDTTFYGTPAARWNGNAANWNTFNWIIKKIRFRNATMGYTGALTTRFDGLHFEGAIIINPILDPSLAAFDQASINAYGRRLMEHDVTTLKDYSAIHAFADNILQSTKNPVIKLKLKYGAKTWIKPNQTVTANLPVYGINNKTHRIVEFAHEWSTKTKLLRTTFGLTPQFLADDETVRPVTSREWYSGELNRILKDLMW